MTAFELLLRSREFESEEAVKHYMTDYDSKSTKEVMASINMYAHQQIFTVALDDVVSQSVKLLKADDYAGWVALVRSYKYPVIISTLIQFIDTSFLCEQLMMESMKQNDKCGMLLTGLLRYQWLWRLHKEDDNGKKEKIAEEIREMVNLYLAYFGAEEVVLWSIRQPEMKVRLVNNETLRHDRYVDLIKNYLYNAVNLSELPMESEDLEYLIFLSQAYQTREGDSKDNLEKILANIVTLLTHRRYIWQHALSQSVVAKMRTVRDNILIVGKEKWKEVMSRMVLRYEGYNCPSISEAYELIDGECWMYCVLLLLSESGDYSEEEKRDNFLQLANVILGQCHVCDNEHLIENNYITPLCLAELVVSQVLTECRENYESSLLDSNIPLRLVVKVLENKNTLSSKTVVGKLMNRKSREWETEKLRLRQMRMQENVIKEAETFFLKEGIL